MADAGDCAWAGKNLEWIFDTLGMGRHPDKGGWERSGKLEHLRVLLETYRMCVFVSDSKVGKVSVCKSVCS